MKTLPLPVTTGVVSVGTALARLVCSGFVLIGVATCLPVLAQTTLLNDNFSDGNSVNQSLPGSAQWYNTNSASTSGLYDLPPQNSVANFTSGTGSSQSLSVGDAITFNFTFKVTGAINSDHTGFVRGFRVGLLNSNGATLGNVSIYDSSYLPFTGYFAALNLKPSTGDAGPIALIKRSATDGTSLVAPAASGTSFLILNNAFTEAGSTGHSTNPYTTLGIGGTASETNWFIDGTTYTGTLTVLRDATSSMTLTLGVTGGTLAGYSTTVSDTSSIFSSFNSIAIGPTSGDVTDFTLQSAQVTYTAVPESSTYAVIAGAFALVGACFVRRRMAVR